MKQSVGTTAILNIIIVFLVTIFAAITGIISYNKAYKVSTRIGDAIERAEGYNGVALEEINRILSNIGYKKDAPNCKLTYNGAQLIEQPTSGTVYKYCVYYNPKDEQGYYQYDVLTYIYFDFPVINELEIPIMTKTDRIYCFSGSEC